MTYGICKRLSNRLTLGFGLGCLLDDLRQVVLQHLVQGRAGDVLALRELLQGHVGGERPGCLGGGGDEVAVVLVRRRKRVGEN